MTTESNEQTRKDPAQSAISAWIAVHRAHRLLIAKVESDLKSANLPALDWYDVLWELYRAGKSGLRQFEIGERILLSKHNLSRLLDRLEAKQLLQRQLCDEDGRGYRVYISEGGQKMLKKMWPVYSQSINEYFAKKLSEKELSQLNAILNKVLT